MKVFRIKTDGKAVSTGSIMRQVVEKYYMDMAPYASWSHFRVFDKIKSLPYRTDPRLVETIMRPLYTMRSQGCGGDCDCKAVALASWARLHRMPYRFVAIKRPGRKTLHHVAVELYIGDKWIFADPTYAFNVFGQKREEEERVYI